jgi:cytochrome c peroxidase
MKRMTHVHTGCVQGVHAMCLLIWGAGAALADPISLDDFVDADPAQARIGQLLFYDKILSGNRNISCGTCHHHDQAGGDGLSLGIGEGGIGVGPDRTAEDIRKRIPRNAPSLWNIGHNSIDLLFWDGRLEVSDQFDNGFDSPAEEWLPAGLDNIVAAQSLFPLTAQFEMAGNPGENDIAGATHDRIDAAWPIIEARIRAEPEYVRLFMQAFENVNESSDITIVEIGNAMGAFITTEWRSFDSPYDAWLTGTPLPDSAERGRDLFFGTAGCASCHSGPLFSDQDFHALGLPAFGPGRTRSFDKMPRDVGRMGETDLLSDAYRFRTPSLRNVALTAPYGHNGAYPNLGDMIRHHLDPVGARTAWTTDMAALPVAPWMGGVDFAIQQDSREMARQQAVLDIVPVTMNATQVADIEAFLHALTGNMAEERPLGRPATVPSGLPVD